MTQKPLHLGALPPEVFDKIFFELDTIRDLANFIAIARFAYRRFRARQQTILFRVLQNELGPVLPDARFLFVFPYSDPAGKERYYEWIHVMAGVYLDMLPVGEGQGLILGGDGLCVLLRGEGQGVRGDPGPPPLKELTELCRTLHLINFITDTYATAQLASFDLVGGGGTPATAPLSRSERHRVMRAFYRRQIVSNAWASTRRPAQWEDLDSYAFSNRSTEHGQRPGLFAAFDPWDMQNIDHADYFIMRLCRALVYFAAAESAAGGGRGISARQFGNLHAHLDHLVRYLRQHRGVAEAAIGHWQAVKSLPPDERVRLEYVYRYNLLPMARVWQGDWSQSFPEPILDREEREGLLVDDFVGDRPGQVPFGWSDALRGRYVQQYGEGLDLIPWLPPWEDREKYWEHTSFIELWRHAGFTLWDGKRVEALKRLRRFECLRTGFLLDRS